MTTTTTHRRSLNQDQLTVLTAIYSCRFTTRSLLATYLKRPNNTSLYYKLQLLIKRGYLATRYNNHYRIAGREAEYYVTANGLRVLRDKGVLKVDGNIMSAIYKDKTVSRNFIDQLTTTLKIRNQLHDAHEGLLTYSSRDTQTLDYFPSPKPNLFLSLKTGGVVTRFFLEYIAGSSLDSKARKTIRKYSEYHEDGAWSDTGTPFPGVILIAGNKLKARTIRRLIEREKYRSDTDINYYMTTLQEVINLTPAATEIWTNISEPGELLALPDL